MTPEKLHTITVTALLTGCALVAVAIYKHYARALGVSPAELDSTAITICLLPMSYSLRRRKTCGKKEAR